MTRAKICIAIVLAAWEALCVLPTPLFAAPPATQPASFIRFVDRGDQGGELDTADMTFASDRGVVVHLIAAVHVGERSYYQKLADDFDGYDAVLYELIMPKNATPPAGHGAGEGSPSTISRVQILLKQALDLQFQLDVIDYTKPNFVHADLDKETFEKLEADRGESIWTLMLQAAMNSWANPPATNDDPAQDMRDMAALLCRPDGQRQLKLVLGRQMQDLESISAGLTGPGGSVILTERNKAAMAALDRVLARGDRKVAIFFGAAHMPDLSQRLAERGFKPVTTQWRMAWDMTIRPNQPSMAEKLLDQMIDSMGAN